MLVRRETRATVGYGRLLRVGYLKPRLIATLDVILGGSTILRLADPPSTNGPLHVGQYKGRQWWVFQGQVYSTAVPLDPAAVSALISESENKVKTQVARAKALMAQVEQHERSGRARIPADVMMFVWQRDDGKCVRCRSDRNLEFDHIIPVSMGGATTARNLQLLCEACNRAKGGSLV